MHRIPADYVSLFIRNLQWMVTDTPVALQALLKQIAQAKLQNTDEGLALVGTATDGSSVNYAIPSPTAGMSLSPETLTLMVGRLWQWVDDCLASTPGATDAQIIAYMQTQAAPVRLFRPSFYWNIR